MYGYRRPPTAVQRAKPEIAATSPAGGAGNAAAQEQMTVEKDEEGSLLDAPATNDGISGGTTHADGSQHGLAGGGVSGIALHDAGEEEAKPTSARLADANARRSEASGGYTTAEGTADTKQQLMEQIGGWSKIPGGREGAGESNLPGQTDAAQQITEMSGGPNANDMKNSSDKQSQQSENPSITKAKEDVQFTDHVAKGYERDGMAGAASAVWSYIDLHTRDHEATERNNRFTGASIGNRGRPAPDADTGSGRMPHGVQVGKKRVTRAQREKNRRRMVGGPDVKGPAIVQEGQLEEHGARQRNPYINPADGAVTNGTTGGPATPEGARRVTPTGQPGSGLGQPGSGTSTSTGTPGGPAPDDPTQAKKP